MKSLPTQSHSSYVNIALKFIVVLVIAISGFFSSKAETSDSVYATLSQVTKYDLTDTFRTTTNAGYMNYVNYYPNNEVAFVVYLQFPINPLFTNPDPWSRNYQLLVLVIRDFHGVGYYQNLYKGSIYETPQEEPWWSGNSAGCHFQGRIIVEEFDSAANYIKGSFTFDSSWCSLPIDQSNTTQRINGTFRLGYSSQLTVLPGNKFDLEIGKSQNLDITLSNGGLPVAGANIYVIDTVQSNNAEKLIGQTNASGKINYLVNTDKVTKEKLSTLRIRAVKDGIELATRNVEINLKFPSTCFEVSVKNVLIFSICGVGIDHWETKEDEPTLTSPSGVVINNFIHFDGIVTIDTIALGIKAVGELFLKDVPLPGGKTGNFSFGKGTFDFALLGETGLITLLSITGKESGCTLFEGYEIDITDIKLLGGRNAHGVEISATIKINGLTKTCGIIGVDESEFGIDGLAISKTEGISVKGFSVSNLGLYYPGFCMENFVFNYDKKADKLSVGASLKIPICTIGGGFQIAKGSLDSIGWSLEAKYPPLVVFAPTTIGMSGFYGKIDGFAKNSVKPFGVKLGGIMCDAVVPIAYSFKVYGQYTQPSYLELGAEDISFFKIGGNWQIVGAGSISVDVKQYLIKLKAELKAGTTDGEEYYFKGNGELAYSKKTEQGGLAGQLSGDLTIPALSDTKLQRWLSKKIGLPYTATAYARMTYRNPTCISGEVYFGKDYGNVIYSLNFAKSPSEPEFLFLNIPTLGDWVMRKAIPGITALNEKEIAIPADSKFALLIRNDVSEIQSSTLLDPDNVEYTSTVINDKISYEKSDDSKEEYWTLLTPKAGIWKLKYTPATNADSLDVFVMPINTDNNFVINSTQTSKTITVSWDNTYLVPDDSVDIYFGPDSLISNAEYIGTYPATVGSASIEIDTNLTLCSFYVSANLTRNRIVYSAHSNKLHNNFRPKFIPPSLVQASYEPTTEKLSINWVTSKDPEVVGYVIKIIDYNGKDSVLTTMFKEQSYAEFYLKDASNKKIEMLCFTENGEYGCPRTSTVFNSVDEFFPASAENPIRVYPNPTNGVMKLSYNSSLGQYNDIQLVNLFGESVFAIELPNSGSSNDVKEFDLSGLPTGVYYLKYNLNQRTFTNTVMIIK